MKEWTNKYKGKTGKRQLLLLSVSIDCNHASVKGKRRQMLNAYIISASGRGTRKRLDERMMRGEVQSGIDAEFCQSEHSLVSFFRDRRRTRDGNRSLNYFSSRLVSRSGITFTSAVSSFVRICLPAHPSHARFTRQKQMIAVKKKEVDCERTQRPKSGLQGIRVHKTGEGLLEGVLTLGGMIVDETGVG